MQIVLLNGGKRNMAIPKKIDRVAILWNKTKDPKYKEEWYRLIKEWAHGPNNIDRRDVSSSTSDKTDDGRYRVI